jgi:hypothetical protein
MPMETSIHAAALLRPPFRELFKVFDGTEGNIGGVESSLWWRALCLVLNDSGAPLEDVLGLQWTTIDMDRRLMRMPGTSAHLLLHPEAVTALRSITEPRRADVFPWPGSIDALRQEWERLIDEAVAAARKGGGL